MKISGFKEQLLDNHRAFYATLVCFCTLIINVWYYFAYSVSPLTIISVLPIVFWIAYDGNEHETATVEGYWIWNILLVVSTIIVIMYPMF